VVTEPCSSKGKIPETELPLDWTISSDVKKLSNIVYRIQDVCNHRKQHFDRLKPCDPNTRTSQENMQGNQTPTRDTSPAVAPSSSPTPPGTNLQSLDDDDMDI